jgi:hypothetical protein
MRLTRRRQDRSMPHKSIWAARAANPGRWWAVIPCRERYSSGAGERKV